MFARNYACQRDPFVIKYERSLETPTKVVSFTNFLTQRFSTLTQLSTLYEMDTNHEFMQKAILFREISIVSYQDFVKEMSEYRDCIKYDNHLKAR